ncbi:type I-F CRISPR-associated helicase Cas3f [Chlamydiales bacterium]|nr:type I-F CRISPR-associated helicase Cas3f [Chlamydiales bacterium]
MKVLFISQCSKNALTETRRIIDQFAERKGDAVWETHITEQGLKTVHKLLKKSARRNTAVACYLFRGKLQTEALWVVGNRNKFNQSGSVPTNTTRRDILRGDDENASGNTEAIAILTSIAGLFHDFGKANTLFQNKLNRKGKLKSEPFRHEWISLILFKQFVGESSDKEWLERLTQISPEDEKKFLCNFPKDKEELKKYPLKGLPNLAKFIGWLILSHHRLPVSRHNEAPRLNNIDNWMEGNRFSVSWNSPDWDNKDWKNKHWKDMETFPFGTPIKSSKWRAFAKVRARRALRYYDILDHNWFNDRFSMHLMRLSLMLSDHHYSAGDAKTLHQDETYQAYANTDKKSRTLKQKLDEHNIGVAKNAYKIAKRIPKMRKMLPAISNRKEFKKRSKTVKFLWQDQSYDLACELKDASSEYGFFGINLASTGCGKTLANAKIMYGLADESIGCRFSIALGLRVLTLQTGDALKKRLSLKSEDIAVMIGSQSVRQLHELNNIKEQEEEEEEEEEDLIADAEVVYEGNLDDGLLSEWIKPSEKLRKIISSPILVSTIDHLIGATEGCRGGKQIAPILRLLTSDLVLDEPDDFDIADLPALCRLVNFAGVFGARVLLSSATLAPSIVQALFESYVSGRKAFNDAHGKESLEGVCCAWFDEFGVNSSRHSDQETYMASHREFIKARVSQIEQQTVLRRAELVPLKNLDAKSAMVDAIRDSIYLLHDNHHQMHPSSGKKASIGLVRMANISPMVAVVKKLLAENEVKPGYCIHFCVYHSRFPLLIRSKIEEVLDRTLSRHDPKKIWDMPEVKQSLEKEDEENHIFVVFATPVAEVGRDHDYDWAVVEPSSMRSIIQLAGRVQRHRCVSPTTPNIMILQNNFKGLSKKDVAYSCPGFELKKDFKLTHKNLSFILRPIEYENITAIPRLSAMNPLDPSGNLSDLEHARMNAELLGDHRDKFHASMWWKCSADWCGEIQNRSLFRKSQGKEKEYFYHLEEEDEDPVIHTWNKNNVPIPVEQRDFKSEDFHPVKKAYPWIQCDVADEIKCLSNRWGQSLEEISLKFTCFRTKELKDSNERWHNNPILGFYRE